MVSETIAFISLAVWAYLAIGHGGFWRCGERDDGERDDTDARILGAPSSAVSPNPPPALPRVAVVIPARDEADGIGACLASLFRQDYGGAWSVTLVDDHSSDGTATAARRVAADCGAQAMLTIVSSAALPAGWTGKLWALRQGVEAVEAAAAVERSAPSEYILLTDADIVYAPAMLSWLVAHARRNHAVLTSLMVKLRCDSFAERALIPAFIFFFQMLYPFAWVNRTDRATAAAAGGCMLIRADALRRAGGLDAIRDALIDDCALARLLKARGPIWLGLTARVASIRGYPQIDDIRRMVSRSAYAQLGYSPWHLLGTVAAMTLVYLAPPFPALFGSGATRFAGIAAWAVMAVLYWPVLRFYGRSPLWAPALPAVAFAYLLFTVESAINHMRGKGGLWKGRFQAASAE
jgi:hopene-associated glycosyltransferase HpnB